MTQGGRGILVTGGGGFLAEHIAAALLANGASVELLIQPGSEDSPGALEGRVRWSRADVWSPGSLRGKARGYSCVIHAMGSLIEDKASGASFARLNLASARNVANMCIGDGVPKLVFISAARAPWHRRAYIQSKRAAENYLLRSGLRAVIVRSPLLYTRGQGRPLFFRLMTGLGRLPPLTWLGPGNAAPMAVDEFALGVAQLALTSERDNTIAHARDLRRLARESAAQADGPSPIPDASQLDEPDEDLPFGWTPGSGANQVPLESARDAGKMRTNQAT